MNIFYENDLFVIGHAIINNCLVVQFKNGRKASFDLIVGDDFKVWLNPNGNFLDGNKEEIVASCQYKKVNLYGD